MVLLLDGRFTEKESILPIDSKNKQAFESIKAVLGKSKDKEFGNETRF